MRQQDQRERALCLPRSGLLWTTRIRNQSNGIRHQISSIYRLLRIYRQGSELTEAVRTDERATTLRAAVEERERAAVENMVIGDTVLLKESW